MSTETLDETPPLTDSDFVGEFADSTPEAPWGYLANGEPRKRRPKGSGRVPSSSTTKGPSVKRMPASESQARAAAALLVQVNALTTMGVMAVGFTDTASAIAGANEGFEEMAFNALLTDPALCKQILKAGTTSGKVALVIAYGMLAVNVVPVAVNELREKRADREAEYDDAPTI